MKPGPPSVLRRLLTWVLPPGRVRDGLLGDLDELYAERAGSSRTLAGLWYARQVLSATAHYPLRRMRAWVSRGVGHGLLEGLARDAGYAVRTLRRSPGFAAVTVLTLALSIGATTATYSVVHGVLLEPLPFEEPDRLVSIEYAAPGIGIDGLDQSHGLHFTYLDENRSFESLGISQGVSVAVTGVGAPEEVEALRLTHTVLPILRIRPAIGREFDERDDVAGGPATVVLGHGYWQTRFGGDPDVIGHVVVIDGEGHEIIGVMPADVHFLDDDPAVYLPFRFGQEDLLVGDFSYRGLARLRPGVTIEQANADVERMIPLAVQRYSEGLTAPILEQMRLAPRLRPLKERVVGDIGNVLWVLLGTVGIVLLIACVNIANLFLVRASEGDRVTSVRAALGASRGALARERLAESTTLGLLGGAAGLLLAHVGVTLLQIAAPDGLPRLSEIAIRSPVLFFALGLALAAGLLFGLMPLLRGGKDLSGTLKEGGRGVGTGRRHGRMRDTLVAAQLALALVLLVGAGLFVRSLLALGEVRPGFEQPEEVLTVRINVPFAEIEEPEEVVLAHEQMLGNLEAIPGVTSVGASSRVTMDGSVFGADALFLEGFPLPEGQMPPVRRYKFILPGYVETMQNPVLAGRSISWADIHERARVAVITENLALEYWDRAADAIGQRVRAAAPPGGDDQAWHEIVGVVGNIRDDGVAEDPVPTVYWPVINESFWGEEVWVSRSLAFAIRTSRLRTAGFLDEVSAAIWVVNPNLPLANVQTLQEILARSTARTSVALVLLSIAAAAALLLGAVGIYGLASYAVAQRRHELGVRMALGAQRGEVARLVLRHALVLAAIGATAGVVMALGLTRLIATLLYGVSAVDPLTFVVMVLFVVGTTMLATWVPALRAARVEPTTALRNE